MIKFNYQKKLTHLFLKLRNQGLNAKEFEQLYKSCFRVTLSVGRRYGLQRVTPSKDYLLGVTHTIVVDCLLKCIKSYSPLKSSFLTYFYYKACSRCRSEIGKIRRRFALIHVQEL